MFFNLKQFEIVPSCLKPNWMPCCFRPELNCRIENPKCLAFLIESITNMFSNML